MKCYDCSDPKATMTSVVETRDYDGVAFVPMTLSSCNACGAETLSSQNTKELEDEIAWQLAMLNERELKVKELVWLRKYIGASGRDWADYLGKQPGTVSRWETEQIPYPRAVRLLLRAMALKGPTEWAYDTPLAASDDAPLLTLRYNSARRLYRV